MRWLGGGALDQPTRAADVDVQRQLRLVEGLRRPVGREVEQPLVCGSQRVHVLPHTLLADAAAAHVPGSELSARLDERHRDEQRRRARPRQSGQVSHMCFSSHRSLGTSRKSRALCAEVNLFVKLADTLD